MQVRGVGRFPPRGAPRVLWAGIEGAAGRFAELEETVATRLAACCPLRAEAPGRPHVTLARVREARGLQTSALLDGFEGHDFGTASVEAITLFESRQASGGVQYVALQQTMLSRR
jgi:2'-5' RNA ligase